MTAFPFSEYIVPAIFALAVGTTIAGALIAVGTTRIIRAVCGLMICCVGLAGLYYFLNSPFLALMEILIYVGAVCITIVFGVMLSEPDEPKEQPKSSLLWTAASAFVALLVGLGLANLSLKHAWPASPVATANDGSVAAIGRSLLTNYSLAFELISLVLLLAILGALVIARGGRKPTSGLPQFVEQVGHGELRGPKPSPQSEHTASVSSSSDSVTSVSPRSG